MYITWYDFGARDAFFKRSINNGGTFQGVVNLSNSGTVDELNIVALAAAGTNVYAAWDDYYGTHDILLKRSTNNGSTFSAVKNLSNGGGSDALGPDLAATGTNVYAAWSDVGEVYFARSTNSGGTFSAKVNLSNNAGFSNDPQVATSGTNVYFTWSDNTPGNNDIFLRRSTNSGGTLQPLVQISNNAGYSILPQVTTVGANVYIIWMDDTPGNNDIIERRSHDNGATWQPTQNLSTNAGSSELAQIDGRYSNETWAPKYVRSSKTLFQSCR